jgi:uncharacterized membrane protein
MKYVVMILILIPSFYALSFAKYNWKKKNRMAAIGVILLTAISIVLPITLLYRQ